MDIDFSSADPLAAALCPLGNRRTKAELFLKLFVVHFTTIAAFCHLLNLRNESILNWRPYVFVFVPYAFLTHQVLALVPIVIGVPALATDMESAWGIMRSLLTIAFGKVQGGSRRIDAEEGGIGQYQPLTLRPKIEFWIKKIARALAAIAFLFQCTATVVLYVRRKQHSPESISMADQRIFELAIGGLFVGVLTLGIVLDVPILHDTAPIPKDGFEGWVALLADRPDMPLPQVETLKEGIPFHAMFAGTISLTATWVLGNFEVLMTLEPPLTIWMMTMDSSPGTQWLLEAVIGSIFALITFGLMIWLVVTDDEYNGRNVYGKREVASMIGNLFMFLIMLGILILFTIEFAAGLIPVGAAGVRQYVRLFSQLDSMVKAPVDVGCPLLWKDWLDDQIWWLA